MGKLDLESDEDSVEAMARSEDPESELEERRVEPIAVELSVLRFAWVDDRSLTAFGRLVAASCGSSGWTCTLSGVRLTAATEILRAIAGSAPSHVAVICAGDPLVKLSGDLDVSMDASGGFGECTLSIAASSGSMLAI